MFMLRHNLDASPGRAWHLNPGAGVPSDWRAHMRERSLGVVPRPAGRLDRRDLEGCSGEQRDSLMLGTAQCRCGPWSTPTLRSACLVCRRWNRLLARSPGGR